MKVTSKVKSYLIAIVLLSSSQMTFAQGGLQTDKNLLGQLNTITTAVPFLTITPDARAAGMGDIGVATSPDANGLHWNPGKMAFIEDDAGLSLGAAPWLKRLVPDIWFYYLSGYIYLVYHVCICSSKWHQNLEKKTRTSRSFKVSN